MPQLVGATKPGVRVEAAQGPTAQVGIRRDYIVLRIGATDIQNAQQLDTVVCTLELIFVF